MKKKPSKKKLSDVDSTTFSFLYSQIFPSNSVSKYANFSLDNLLDSTSESTLRRQPRHRYNLRNNSLFYPSPSHSHASTNSSLVRHHAHSRSSGYLSSRNNIPTAGVDVAISQRSSLSFFTHTGLLFSRPSSQNPSVISSDYHLNIDLTTDQFDSPYT